MIKIITKEFVIIDCPDCDGSGKIWVLGDSECPAHSKKCETCKGFCVVRIPVEELSILHLEPRFLTVGNLSEIPKTE